MGGGQSGEQGGQSPALQAAHLTTLLRKAAAGADARVGRSKYEYGRPGDTHVSRPRRAYRSKARARLASGSDDVSSEVPDGPGGPAGVRKPGTPAAQKSPTKSFSPQHSDYRAEGRGKSGVSTGSPLVDSTLRPQLNVSSPSASDLGKEAEKVISGIRSSELSSEADKVIAGVRSNLQDISTPELAASKVTMSPRSWLTGKLGNLVLSKGSQMSKKVQSGKPAPAAQQQLSTSQISKTQQQPACQDNAGPAQGAAGGELPAPQAD